MLKSLLGSDTRLHLIFDLIHLRAMPEKEGDDKEDDKDAKRVPSDQPTAMIAPSDYEHIFNGEEENQAKPEAPKPTETKPNDKEDAKRVPSDQPTALIAPSDYEHIFQGKDEPKKVETAKQADAVDNIASQTPMAIIAPSDFEHIYRDPAAFKEANKAKQTKDDKGPKKVPSRFNKPTRRESTTSNKHRSQSRTGSQTNASRKASASKSQPQVQEVLPTSVQMVIKRFIEKQKRTYTINN